jgi:hypothetical protein
MVQNNPEEVDGGEGGDRITLEGHARKRKYNIKKHRG